MNHRAIVSLTLLGSAFVCGGNAEEVALTAEKATVITFPSQTQRTYKLLAAENAAGAWETLQDGIVGTGGEVTIFYKSESNQKHFFKVETSDGPPGQRSLLSLANLDISNKNLSGYDLEGADIRGYTFTGSKFDGANMKAANLSEAKFDSASFTNADLSHAVANNVIMNGAKLNGANLEGIRFVGGVLNGADFRDANLRGVVFDGVILFAANFAGQTLTNRSLRSVPDPGLAHVNFSGANLTGSDLSRNIAYGMNLDGAIIDAVNFEGTLLSGVSMKDRDLRTVRLKGVGVVEGADWSGVNANGVDLFLATLRGLNATAASFEAANLEGLVVGNRDYQWGLTNVNFRNANLRSANLEGIIFRNCDFTGADMSFANLIAADLTGCVGFDAEQPGMRFGGWPQNPPPGPARPTATILPDGSPRSGTNPGTGLAPSTAPAKLQFLITDGGVNRTVNLQLAGGSDGYGSYSEDGVPTGNYIYEPRGRIGLFTFHDQRKSLFEWRTLVFTSAAGGDLFPGNGPSYQIGTFTVQQ